MILFVAIGLGLVWHGSQIVWVAPRPSQFDPNRPELGAGSPAAFNRFWLDQYAWIGVGLVVVGVACVVAGLVL